jgi:hypothetical protein
MRVGPVTGEYATAVRLDDEPCLLWPECGCPFDGLAIDCEERRPAASRPMIHIVEFILITSIFALGVFVLWAFAHFSGGIHA